MRVHFPRSLMLLPLAGIALMSGCARHRDVVVAPPPPAPVQPVAAPMPPMGATANMRIPAVGADGRRVTPNRNLSAQATLWHVRMALNVAALSCHDATDAVRLNYNQFLKVHKATLAKANAQVDGEYKTRFGAKSAIPQRETLNTSVYNFFALPPVQKAFCAQAASVGGAVNGMTSADLLAYAPTGLAALERPFTDFYDAYAIYEGRLAQWRSSGGQLTDAGAPPSHSPVKTLTLTLSQADMTRDDDVIAPRGPLLRALAVR